MAEINKISISNGIAEEARRADANALKLLHSYSNRYSLRWMFSKQNRLLLNALGNGGRILEVGCGIGNFLVDAIHIEAISKIYAVEVGLKTAKTALDAAPEHVSLLRQPRNYHSNQSALMALWLEVFCIIYQIQRWASLRCTES